MFNQIKMAIYKDGNNKLKKNITRPLPEEMQISNSLILSYSKNDKLHFDATYVLPHDSNLGKPVSFDFLFVTGEYEGLYLENVKPLNIKLSGFKNTEIENDTKAIIIPAKLLNQPNAYDDNFYYFQLGDYTTPALDIHAVMNIYNRICQDKTMTLEEVKELIDTVNSKSFIEEVEYSG